MLLLTAYSAFAQAASKETNTTDVVIKVLSIGAPALALLSALFGWLRARAARVSESSGPRFAVLRLRTPPLSFEHMDAERRNWLLISLGLCFAVGIATAVFLVYQERDSFGLFDLGLAAEALALTVFGFVQGRQLIGKKAGEPLKSYEAELLVDGNLHAIVEHCRGVLLRLGALGPEGVRVAISEPSGATLVGRVGGGVWGKYAGERVTIAIGQERGTLYRVWIQSSFSVPRLINLRANKRNVRRVLERLI